MGIWVEFSIDINPPPGFTAKTRHFAAHPTLTVLPEARREIDRACVIFLAAEARAENL